MHLSSSMICHDVLIEHLSLLVIKPCSPDIAGQLQYLSCKRFSNVTVILQVRQLESEKLEVLTSEEKEIAEQLQDLLQGSSRLNARKGGLGADACVLSIPSVCLLLIL